MGVKQAIAIAIGFVIMLTTISVSANIKQTFACGVGLTLTINANPMSGVAPLTVNFSAIVNGGTPPYTYNWNFAGLGSSNQQNPQFTFNSAGNYTVTLTVTDSSQPSITGQASIIIQVTSGQQGNPDFTISVNPASATVSQGQSANTTLTVNTINNFTGTLTLSLVNPPTGVTLSPTSVNVTQNNQQVPLTISTSSSTPTGSYSLVVQAVSGSITRQTTFALTVSSNMQTGNYSSSYSWYFTGTFGSFQSATVRNAVYVPPSNAVDAMDVAIGRQVLSDGRANDAPDTIKILIVGDVGNTNNGNTSILGQGIANENPDLVVLLGDYIYGFSSTDEVDNWFNTLNLTNRRVISVAGNHDVYQTLEGGSGSPQSQAVMNYLFSKLYMPYSSSGILRFHNVAFLLNPSATFGPASGSADATDTTYSAVNMQQVSYGSMTYNYARVMSKIVKSDPNAEWRIFVSHYQLLGYNTSPGAGRDRNDLRFYLAPFLIKDNTDSNELESFDLTIHGHLHNYARSVVWLPNNIAPYFADIDTRFASANYGNNGSVDFTNTLDHGLITIIQGAGGASNGDADLNYANDDSGSPYPISAYSPYKNFSARENLGGFPKYTLLVITNTKGQTPNSGQTKMDIITKSYSSGSWNTIDTFSIIKNRRNAGDITINNININDPAATAPFDLNHTNYYDWRWNHGKVINDDDRYESSTITISAWFRLEEGRGTNNVSVGWQESSGPTTNTDSSSTNFLIIGKLGVLGDTDLPAANDEGVNVISVTNTGGSLVFTTEDPAGVNITKTVAAPANLIDQKWHHVVFVRNGNTTGQFYLDGVAVGSSTMTPDAGFTTDDNNPYNIQAGFDKNMARFFQGQIANVAVWNSALTATDVANLYNNPTSASILSSAFLRVYFPPNGPYPDTNTAVSYSTSTLKDINNYNTTTPASYVKHYQATIGSNLTITPTWRYADSGSFQ
ncbi:MAG: LamG-like jellyroll fold domain-containing protein, partial [Candidatus Nitrosocaldaceae archaeon]